MKCPSLMHKILPVAFLFTLVACNKTPKETPLTIRENPADAEERARQIRDGLAIELAPGLTFDLWASDSLAPDPIAMSIDDEGRVYTTSAHRQENYECDVRGFRHWMTPTIAVQSDEDRRAFLRSTFAPEKSKENEWLNDLN